MSVCFTYDRQCVLDGKTITFFGDSISRYCYFGFNTFLETGELREDSQSARDDTFGTIRPVVFPAVNGARRQE